MSPERRSTDKHLKEVSDSVIKLTTCYEIMTNSFSKLVEDNSDAHKEFYNKAEELKIAVSEVRINQKNHEDSHTIKSENKKDNKSTAALIISGIIAIMVFLKNIVPWVKGH